MDKYQVKCLECDKEHEDWALSCECHSFLRAEYKETLKKKDLFGMWKYIDWLPCTKPIETKSGPITYKSKNLANEIGLKNLYISFNGYWPEKNAYNMTCSFKDLEASPTISRAIDCGIESILIASAGNTARAFAHVSNRTGFKVYLAVPEKYLWRLWTPEKPRDNINLIAVKGDYSDSITIGNKLSERMNISPEGGAKNIARRDGMGTVLLDAVDVIGRIPKHYFQAIGSGTGAIACWEMATRLRKCGWKGWLKLNLSQNIPFIPIFNAWRAKRNKIIPGDMPDAEISIEQLFSSVLSNRNPPYSIKGGLFDALKDTNGEMYAVTNKEAEDAGKLFEVEEGIDPLPAASVAIASLIQAINKNKIDRDDTIILNITGGGLKKLKKDFKIYPIKPKIVIKDIEE